MARVLYTATLVRGHIAKFHIPYLKWFKEQGWETWVAARNDYPDGVCEIPYCDYFVDIPFARSPFSGENVIAYRELKLLLDDVDFDIIHTHTPVGSVLTRLAARNARKRGAKVFYTAHGFHFYDGAPAINWLLWYPTERLMSRFADVLITINQEDFARAKRFAHCAVEYVPGVGVDLEKLGRRINSEVKRREFGLSENDFVLLSVGDLTKNKNHSTMIKALPLLDSNVKLLVCGEGAEKDNLHRLVEKCGLSDRVKLLGFVENVAEIYSVADAFVLLSKREGLPASIIEAMAGGLPIIASEIRGVTDLVVNGESGILVKVSRPTALATAVKTLQFDSELRLHLAKGAKFGATAFDASVALDAMKDVYCEQGFPSGKVSAAQRRHYDESAFN